MICPQGPDAISDHHPAEKAPTRLRVSDGSVCEKKFQLAWWPVGFWPLGDSLSAGKENTMRAIPAYLTLSSRGITQLVIPYQPDRPALRQLLESLRRSAWSLELLHLTLQHLPSPPGGHGQKGEAHATAA